MDNTLYYGDNLDILRRYVPDESVDLVYLDPPFNSNATYNVLFGDAKGAMSTAQIQAFDDTWHWDHSAAEALDDVLQFGGRPAEAMRAFELLLGHGDMLAYLSMMAPRLIELRRVLKPTGSIYLHCDPTASHYLKVLLDAIFGPENYRSEIIWKRYHAHNDAKHYGAVHDVILFYSRGRTILFNKQHQPYEASYIEERFRFADPDGRRWSEQNLASPNPRPNLTYPYTASNGITYQPPPNGWKYTPARMAALDKDRRLHFPKRSDGRLRLKNYMDELPGLPIQDLWTDIVAIGGSSPERLGYPTQKPLALLERIIAASSNEGDVVLDPFCGCGTAVVAAQKLGRRWVGIDLTHLAINLMRTRIKDTFGDEVKFKVVGEPTTTQDADELARTDPYQFQFWALGLVGARPAEQKKGADQGIDGRLYFRDDPKAPSKQVIISVKAGKLQAGYVRDLVGVIAREKAAIGVLISMGEPTKPMREEIASHGFYESPWGTRHPRMQMLTIEQLMAGKRIDYPASGQRSETFRQAPRAPGEQGRQGELFGEE